MRRYCFALSAIVAWTATTAWGQYSPYGAPDVVRLPQVPAAALGGYPNTATEAALPDLSNPPATIPGLRPLVSPTAFSSADPTGVRPAVMMPQAYYGPYAAQAPGLSPMNTPNRPLPPAPQPEIVPNSAGPPRRSRCGRACQGGSGTRQR